MDTSAASSRPLWHVGRGIVFAEDGSPPYPPLSPARPLSGSTAVPLEGEDGSACLPPLDARQQTAAGRGLPSAQVVETTTSAAGAVTVTTTTTTTEPSAVADATKDSQPKDAAAVHVPPYTPLDFKIPDEVFQFAKQAPEGSPDSYWSYRMYRRPGQDGAPDTKVKVHYCTSLHTTERVLQQYFVGEKLLGFDLEWAFDANRWQGPRRNVSVVQLASESRIGLFHLALYPKKDPLVAPSLKKIMEDPEITKVGVWIKGDCTRLSQYLGIEARGIFELSHLFRLVKYSSTGQYNLINKKLVSLATQVEECLGLPLFKEPNVRASDWSQNLQRDQIDYSASDVYAMVHLYAVLDHQRKNLRPTPPLPYHAELDLPIRLAEGAVSTPAKKKGAGADKTPVAKDEPAVQEKQENLDSGTVGVQFDADGPAEAEAPEPSQPQQLEQQLEQQLLLLQQQTEEEEKEEEEQKPKPKAKPPRDPRITEAELLTREFRRSHPKTPVASDRMRAFYVWRENAELGPADVGALHDPPLETETVLSYILEAALRTDVSFDRRRMRREVLWPLEEALLDEDRDGEVEEDS